MAEMDFAEAKRKARQEREDRLLREKRKTEAASKPVEEIEWSDIRYIQDVPRLLEIIRLSEKEDVVQDAIDRVYHIEISDDINLIRECLPGNCTYLILKFLAGETKMSVYSYIIDEKLVRKVIPALQRSGWDSKDFDEVVNLLDSFHRRKYDRKCNFEEGVGSSYGYIEIMRQIDDPDPWKAFKNIDQSLYDRLSRIDDSDEFSYISSQDDDMDDYTTCGYSLLSWRWKLLSEANLLIPGVD